MIIFNQRILTLATMGLVTAASHGQRDHDIQPEDYFDLSFITSCQMSGDGSLVAYTEMRWDPASDGRNTDLWQVETETGLATRLTFDLATDANPNWGPEGRWLYFTSARAPHGGGEASEDPPYNKKKQVWRMPAGGGQLFPVTREASGVQSYQLSDDGKSLYYTVNKDEHVEGRWRALREKHDTVEYGHGIVPYSKLLRLDLQTWRSETLIDEDRYIVEFAVSPDEQRIAMITTPTEELITNEGWSRVDIHRVGSGLTTSLPDRMWREEAPSPYGWILGLAWSSASHALAFRVDFDGYPGEIFVARFDQQDLLGVDHIVRPGEVSAEGGMTWMPGTNDLCITAEDHARARVYRIPGAAVGNVGPASILTPGDVVVGSMSFDRSGSSFVVEMNSPTHMGDIFRYSLGSSTPRRLTNINPQVDRWKLPQLQIVKWTSPDGTPVEGILELPPDYEPGDGPLPTVVHIHGGPTASTKYALQFWIYGRTIFAARGWALFSPNYRGSTGFGDRFLRELIGHKNDRDVADILSGVDTLIERGVSDPDRLAVMGWSNGGYLTNCLITHTDRFKAASSGAGVFDTVMQWSIEDTPGHVINYSEGLPWTNPTRMHAASPLYQVDRVVTPTLVHVGEKDPRTPVEHSISLHRSLHHYLNVPCELVVYPGAGHGLTKYSHRKAKLDWDIKWFDYHVLGRE